MNHGSGARLLALVLAAVALGATSSVPSPAAGGPNILLILVDDLGWTDTGSYGSSFYETPNIDRLAAEGMRFRYFYAASPVCSPTRASIFTGKHPARLNITNWIGGEQAGQLLQADYERQLPLAEVTFGEAFRDAGYSTGYIGKWHLGTGDFRPQAQGFDETIAVNNAGQPGSYHWPYASDTFPASDVPGLGGDSGDYLTDRLVDSAVSFLERHAQESFLLVLAHYTVHTPIQGRADLVARHTERRRASLGDSPTPFRSEHGRATSRQRQDRPDYAAMISSLDAGVGRLRQTLAGLGIADNTVVVFTSDNGGLSTLAGESRRAPTSNAPLRAGKGWLYEGGTRVPLVVLWPGETPSGSETTVRCSSADLYPTLLEIAGLPLRPHQHRDGVSLAPVLRGQAEIAPRTLYWHFPHYHGSGSRPSSSIIEGNLKLIEWLEDSTLELYDLEIDPGETTDLATRRPDDAQRLRQHLAAWQRTVGARMPRQNPAWPGPPSERG